MASSQNDDDSELDAMLRQAALLEAQMKSSSSLGADQPDSSFQTSGSSQPGGEAMSLAYSEDAAADDMLLQAELLAAKMRNKSTAAVQDHASVDDMLYKAELLALKMKASEHPNTTPPREANTTTTTAENTPALIRHSERLLSKMHHGRDSGDMPTPELMRRTEHLLDKMKASAHAEATEAMEHLDQARSAEGADDILSRSEALLAHARAASLPDKQDASMLNPPTHHDRSDELKRLMEEALSKWSASSGEDTGRVKDALEHILPTLGSHTPSTVVSVPPREPDDMSSVGSMSPKSLPKSMFSPETIARSAAAPRTSPHRPPLPPPHNVDVAVEMAQKMALALHETPPEESFEAKDAGAARNGDTAGVKESKTNGHSKATLSPEQAEKDKEAQPKAPGAKKTSTKASNDDTQEHVQSRQVPSPPRMDPPAAHSIREPANGKPSPPKRQRANRPPPPPPRLSSEEAQYNAIMNAIDSAPTADTSWEKVESATEKDDDYVPLADYSRKAKFERYSTSSFLEIPTVDRITEFRRRRKSRLGRRIVFMVLLAAIAWWGKTYWLNNESTVSSGMDRGVVEETYVNGMDEPAPPKEMAEESLPVEEPVEEPFPPAVEPAVKEETVLVESERKAPKAGSRMARGVQKALVKFVVSLTPPWERFCELDSGEACRNTKLLMDSMGNS